MELIKNCIIKILSFLNLIIPKNKNIVIFNSFPDFSDNSYALFLYMIQKYPNKKYIWVVNKNYFKNSQNRLFQLNKIYTFKVYYKYSLRGIYYFLRASFIFYTHGLLLGIKMPKNQIIVNLWHGMPLKKIGLKDNKKSTYSRTYAIATSVFFQHIIANSFDIDINKVLISGQPRNDLMKIKGDYLKEFKIEKKNYNSVILWAPTYRQSSFGDIRIDGNYSNSLPIINEEELELFNTFLNSINTFMIIKIHPMDKLNVKSFINYKNIQIIKNIDLEEKKCQFYSLLGEIDILLTDYSSIYIDFLTLNRPMAFLIDDFEMYNNNRGFIFDNTKDYLPGPIINNVDLLKNFLTEICVLKQDNFYDLRNNINKEFNITTDNYSQNLLNKLQFDK